MAVTTLTPTPGMTRRLRSWADAARIALSPASAGKRLADARRRLGITRSGQAAIAGAAGLWVAAKVVAGTPMYLVAYGCVLLVGLAYLIAPRPSKLTAERSGLYPRVQEGDRLQVELRLRAGRRMSTFVLEERLPEQLGESLRVPVTRLRTGQELVHTYALRPARRGAYLVGPLVAVASDPLGLAQRRRVVAEPFEVLVHPRVDLVSDRPLTRQFEDPPIRPPVSRPWPSGFEFSGMRPYVPGDDLRRIVWRAAARTGTLMVREAEQGITDKVILALDTDRLQHSRDTDGGSASFEAGVRVAASIGVAHLRDGYEVRCETNRGELVLPMRGGRHQVPFLDALARLEPDREPLSASLARLIARLRPDAYHVVVTPRLGPTECAQLTMLLNRGASVLVVGLLWSEVGTDVLDTAASLGCQVAGLHPGDDIATALGHDLGGGNRL